jgi:hypothetical protein
MNADSEKMLLLYTRNPYIFLLHELEANMKEMEISNKNGMPVINVGELKELLVPFKDGCPVDPISVFYTMDGLNCIKLSIKSCNKVNATITKPVCYKCESWKVVMSYDFCPECGRALR